MSTLVAIGHPYPFFDICDGSDKALTCRTDGAFDLVCYLSRPTKAEIAQWNMGSLLYGICRAGGANLPLVVFLYEGLVQFDTSFNIHKWHSLDETLAWLNGEGNALFAVLVDADTNVVLGLRALGLSHAFMTELRSGLHEQLLSFDSNATVDAAYTELLNRVSPNDMSADTTFYRAGDPSGEPISYPLSRTHD